MNRMYLRNSLCLCIGAATAALVVACSSGSSQTATVASDAKNDAPKTTAAGPITSQPAPVANTSDAPPQAAPVDAREGGEWSVHVDEPRPVVIAVRGAQSDKGNYYSLRLVCDGRDKSRTLTVDAFDKNPEREPNAKGRDFEWNANRGVFYRESVDDGSLNTQVLARNGDDLNSGKLLIFGLTIFDDTVAEPFPKTRLLLKDIFLDETVEFSFATLTDSDRVTVQKMCRFPDSR